MLGSRRQVPQRRAAQREQLRVPAGSREGSKEESVRGVRLDPLPKELGIGHSVPRRYRAVEGYGRRPLR